MTKLADWPSSERPREKLFNQGVASLSDAELLALLLRQGNKGQNVIDLARDLIKKFNGLRPLLEAEVNELQQHSGLGPAKIAVLKSIIELSRRYYKEQLVRQDCLTNSALTTQYLRTQLRDCQRETFACLFLDNRNQIISFEKLFQGTINQANVHIREIAKRALYHNSSAVILAHNHPSGHPQPSQADIDLTTKIIQSFALFEIQVLDHIIIADNRAISLAELGHMHA